MLNHLKIPMIHTILLLYPLYQTFLCVKSWDKTTKPHFQHWLIFWFLWISTYYVRILIESLWIINIFITFFDLLVIILLIGCYNRWFAFLARKSLIIPTFREIKRLYTKYIKDYVDFNDTKIPLYFLNTYNEMFTKLKDFKLFNI